MKILQSKNNVNDKNTFKKNKTVRFVDSKTHIADLFSKKNIIEPIDSEQNKKKKRRNRFQKHNSNSKFFNIEQNFEVQQILTRKLQNPFPIPLFHASEKKRA